MNRTMITATNTLGQLQKQMDLISNNMANVNTYGYKRREATFSDLMNQNFNNQPNVGDEVNRSTPNGIRLGTGSRLAQTQLVMTQGGLLETNRPLDTAFTKEGQLFKVLVPNGEGTNIQFTRNGAFYLSPVGEEELSLVNGDGYPILDENDNPIYLDGNPQNYSIDTNGHLSVKKADGTTQEFDLGVVLANKPQFLEGAGDNLYRLPENLEQLNVTEEDLLTELVGPLRNEIAIRQSALEQSNVDIGKEMTDLINVQRAYQFQSRSVSIADQMMGLVNGIR